MNLKESPLICSFILSSIIVGIYYSITKDDNKDKDNNKYIICFLLLFISILFLLFGYNRTTVTNTVELPDATGGGTCPF